MEVNLQIIVYDRDEDEALLIMKEILDAGYRSEYIRVDSPLALESAMREMQPDLICCDLSSGFDALHDIVDAVRRKDPRIPIFAVTNPIGEVKAAMAMRAGVKYYVLKSALSVLPKLIRKELDTRTSYDDESYSDPFPKSEKEKAALLDVFRIALSDEVRRAEACEKSSFSEIDSFFKEIADSFPSPVFVKNCDDLKIVYANELTSELFDSNIDNLIGKKSENFIDSVAAEYLELQDREMIRSRSTSKVCEESVPFRSGEIKNLRFTKRLLFSKSGDPKYLVSVAEDVAQRKTAEYNLKKSELRFSKMFESSPVPIAIIHGSEETYLRANDSYARMLCYAPEELIGKNSDTLGIWRNEAKRRKLFKLAKNKGEIKNEETTLRAKNGDLITALVSVNHIGFDEASPWLIVTALDITQREKINREIIYSLEKEKDLNNMKNRFISMISHELRTPLTTIMLSADLLKRFGDGWDAAERSKHFDRIQNTVLRMTQLMENVLTIGRMEAGKFEFRPEAVDLASYCADMAETISFANDANNRIEFVQNGIDGETYLDENLVGLALNNLLTNALKYSDPDTKVVFEVFTISDKVVFSVRDYGIGIPEEDLRKLFDTFYRASNVGKVSGYGLGLSIVVKSIKAHGGNLCAFSEAGVGTTFIAEIPCKSVIE